MFKDIRFFEITWGSSSWLRLLRLLLDCVAAEILLAIFEAISFHIWGVLEPRKESESSVSLLVRGILFFWHFIYLYLFCRDWSFSQIQGVLEAHKQRSRNHQQQRTCSCSSSFYFLWQLFVVISPKSEEFWGEKLVRNHNYQSVSFLEQFFLAEDSAVIFFFPNLMRNYGIWS